MLEKSGPLYVIMEILECGDMSAYPEERKAVNVALMRAHVELNLEQATRARRDCGLGEY